MAQMTNYTPATDIIDPNCMLVDTCYAISPIKNKDLVYVIYSQPKRTIECLQGDSFHKNPQKGVSP